MNNQISYRNTNYENLDDSILLARWYADPAIRHLAVPQRDENSLRNPDTPEKIQAQGRDKVSPFSSAFDLMILCDQQPIGHCSIMFDPPHRLTKEGKVAWFGMTIGEEEYRAKGIGKKTMKYLEKLAIQQGATHVEAGVFEFNEPSMRMCLASGYKPIGRKENFTYWNGKKWADVRLLKKLP